MINSLLPLRPWIRLGKLGRQEALACYLYYIALVSRFLNLAVGDYGRLVLFKPNALQHCQIAGLDWHEKLRRDL